MGFLYTLNHWSKMFLICTSDKSLFLSPSHHIFAASRSGNLCPVQWKKEVGDNHLEHNITVESWKRLNVATATSNYLCFRYLKVSLRGIRNRNSLTVPDPKFCGWCIAGPQRRVSAYIFQCYLQQALNSLWTSSPGCSPATPQLHQCCNAGQGQASCFVNSDKALQSCSQATALPGATKLSSTAQSLTQHCGPELAACKGCQECL